MTEIIIELEGARNARDLGGIRAAGGCITKTGRLFRSGALDSITPADAEKLCSMGLARIVDLRTEIESERCPDIVPNGVTYNFCPVLTGALMGVTREKRTTEQYGQHLLDELNRGISPKVHMQEMYKKIISSPFAQAAYGKFLKLLCETRDGAVLWHCSMGKDRAGIGALVALLALGVSREDAGEDYLLSTKLLCSNNEERAKEILALTGSEQAAKAAIEFNSVDESYLSLVYKYMDDNFGSTDGFLDKACGFNAEDREKLRSMYLQ